MAELTPGIWDKFVSKGVITLDSRLLQLAERVCKVPILYFACYENSASEPPIALFVTSFEDETAYIATNETSGRHYWFDEKHFDFCKFSSEVATILSSDDYNCKEISFEGLSASDTEAVGEEVEQGWITSSIELDKTIQTIEEYISTLKSKQRNDMRKYRSAIVEHNVECRVIYDYIPLESSYYPLYLQVSDRADEYTPEPYGPDYFRIAKEIFGDDAIMVSMFSEKEELLGYMFTLCNTSGCVMQYTGFKQDRELYLWHNLTLNSIEYAIQNGLTFVDMGITNHRAKRQFGAQNNQTYSFRISL